MFQASRMMNVLLFRGGDNLPGLSMAMARARGYFPGSDQKEHLRPRRLSLPAGSDIAEFMKTPSTSASKVITVLTADDHPVVREGLAAIFKSQKDIRVIAEASNGEEACELCDQLSPDVLLLDLRMPKKDGLQAIKELMAHGATKPRIIVMTSYASEEDIRRAIRAGAKGYLVKGTAPQEIRGAVRKVAAGESLLPGEFSYLQNHPELRGKDL
jgi:CheY-like chemotaxis protein